MASQAKEIYTFTGLLLKAAKLYKSDPKEFKHMLETGTGKLISGVRVVAHGYQSGNGSIALFSLRMNGRQFALIRGGRHDGKFYTRYSIDFTLANYSKTAMRYLPITFLDKPKFGKWIPCSFHDADGSIAQSVGCGFIYKKRGREGETCFGDSSLILRDRDGKMMSGTKWFHEEYTPLFNDPVDVMAGFLPGAVGKEEWYESMISPEHPTAGKLWDSATVRMTAARVHSEALKMQSKYSHLKIALYPALPVEKDEAEVRLRSRFLGRFEAPTGSHCLARDGEMKGDYYYLPRLVMYWFVDPAKAGMHSYYGKQIRFIQAFIPPYGNAMLEPENSSDHPLRETKRFAPGPEHKRFERSFHTFRFRRSDSMHMKPVTSSNWEMHFCNWSKARGKVGLLDFSQDAPSSKDGVTAMAVDCDASNAFTSIVERELIDSLPLC